MRRADPLNSIFSSWKREMSTEPTRLKHKNCIKITTYREEGTDATGNSVKQSAEPPTPERRFGACAYQ